MYMALVVINPVRSAGVSGSYRGSFFALHSPCVVVGWKRTARATARERASVGSHSGSSSTNSGGKDEARFGKGRTDTSRSDRSKSRESSRSRSGSVESKAVGGAKSRSAGSTNSDVSARSGDKAVPSDGQSIGSGSGDYRSREGDRSHADSKAHSSDTSERGGGLRVSRSDESWKKSGDDGDGTPPRGNELPPLAAKDPDAASRVETRDVGGGSVPIARRSKEGRGYRLLRSLSSGSIKFPISQ